MHKITLDDPDDYLIWRDGSGRSVEIFDIAVHSERGVGKGTLLLQKMREEIPQDVSLVYAITRIGNTIAHQFYERSGFRIVGRLHDFYRDGHGGGNEHAVMYGLDI